MRMLLVIATSLLVACGGEEQAPTPRPAHAATPVAAREPEPEPEPAAKTESTPEPPTNAKPDAPPKSPSNVPAQRWTQVWATPTGHQTASVAALHDGRIYALAGQYFAFGLPSDHLVCLAQHSGELQWEFKGSDMLTLEGFAPDAVRVRSDDGTTTILGVKDGKAQTRAEPVEFSPIPDPSGDCTTEGTAVRCESWTVTEASIVSDLARDSDRVCYGVEGAREVRCRSVKTGDLLVVIEVPKVPGVKYEGAVNFTIHITGDRVFIGNYDGTVLAYGPA